jgi:hypothetical protein
MRFTVRVVIALAILATALSYFKFNHCEDNNFAGPDQYIHACYSDLPALFSERGFGQGQWAFSGNEQAAEYPVLQGVIMWATAQISSDSPITYFRINIFLIGLLFIASALSSIEYALSFRISMQLHQQAQRRSLSIGISGQL